jgi:hypothetical protein
VEGVGEQFGELVAAGRAAEVPASTAHPAQ